MFLCMFFHVLTGVRAESFSALFTHINNVEECLLFRVLGLESVEDKCYLVPKDSLEYYEQLIKNKGYLLVMAFVCL